MAAEDLHVIGANDGKLWHTIRFGTPEGPWRAFDDVKGKAGNVGDFVDVDCARGSRNPNDMQGILHVVGVTGDGQLWYTVREPGTDPDAWKPFRGGELISGGRGPFLRAAVTTARHANRVEVVVAGVTAAGRLWVTTRKSETAFHPFGMVSPAAGGNPAFRAVALAGVAGQELTTHLAAVSSDGHLWHMVGRPGQWPGLQDVEAPAAAGDKPGDLTDVACSDSLDLGAIAGDGHVWQTTRHPNTSWTDFIDPEADTDVGTFLRIGVARLQSGLHICGVTADGRLWHTLRSGPGARFRDVKAVIRPPQAVGSFQAVACA